jgi:Protein of unknown function (DUF2934)
MAEPYRSTPKQDVPTREQIAQRAYEIYQNRGRQDGRDMEDWLAAEKELRTYNSPSTPASSLSNDKSRGSFVPSRARQSRTKTPAPSPANTSFGDVSSTDQSRSREF